MSIRAAFSEATFQFLVIHEMLGQLGAAAGTKVYIPTLRQEASLGYDARLTNLAGVSCFFQFKIGRQRVRYSKADFEVHNYKQNLQKPYWEFCIRNARQHNLMYQLAATESAFYVASAVTSSNTLYQHARTGEVAEHSAIIDPSESETVAEDKHRFVFWPATYGTGVWEWNFFSTDGKEPRRSTRIDELEVRLRSQLRDAQSLDVLISRIKKTLGEEMQSVHHPRVPNDYQKVVTVLKRFGITWVVFLYAKPA